MPISNDPVSDPRSVWTNSDEAALHELTERKARIRADNLHRIAAVLEGALKRGLFAPKFDLREPTDREALAERLIPLAPALRAALAAFDKGAA